MASNHVKSVSKAFAIISLIAKNGKAMSLTKISQELNMAKSTAHALIFTLIDDGYLMQERESGHYQLGNKLYEIGTSVSSYWNDKKIARPYILKLVEKYKETVHLAKLSDGKVLYIDKVESTQSIRIVTETGTKLPAHCTGVGKILLSGLSDDEIRKNIKKNLLDAYTLNTITDEDDFLIHLKKIRKNKICYDNQEFLVGLFCIAVPIYNHDNQIVSALSVSIPVIRVNNEIIENVTNDLLEVSYQISNKLGSRAIKQPKRAEN